MTTTSMQKTQSQTFAALLEKAKPALAQVLPKALTADRLCRVALATYNRTPALAACDTASVLQALLQAAAVGIVPDGSLGGGWLVPYKGTCTFILGYRGMLDLVRRTGEIASIETRVVREKDKFRVELGLHSDIKHVPCLTGDPGKMIFCYAVAKLKSGETQFEVMSRPEIDAIKNRSSGAARGPWATDYDEMARKTVLRRLFKTLPVAIENRETAEKAEAVLEAESAIPPTQIPVEVEVDTAAVAESALARGMDKAERAVAIARIKSALAEDEAAATIAMSKVGIGLSEWETAPTDALKRVCKELGG